MKKSVKFILILLGVPTCLLLALIISLCILLSQVDKTESLPYEKLILTSPEELELLTGIEAFPPFKYVDNRHSNWDGATVVQYDFENSASTEPFFKEIDEKSKSPDNFAWQGRIFKKGWRSDEMDVPLEDVDGLMVTIEITPSGFLVDYTPNALFEFSQKDLESNTGMAFPEYRMESYRSYGSREYTQEIVLHYEPRNETDFTRKIIGNNEWKRGDDGTYTFIYERQHEGVTQYEETYVVNPLTGYIFITKSDF